MTHDEDDDTQVQADTLLIVYQRGFADGKAAAQRKPLTDEEIKQALTSVDPETKRLPPGMKAFARAIEAAHGIKEGT
jgi:CelD/BcsL family acetyltransferase involved in cellulose biosynthesis